MSVKDRENISVVWFKRDLRLHDNEAISAAFKGKERVLFLYVFEPIILEDPHYSKRHFDFIDV